MRINPTWRVTWQGPDRAIVGTGTGAVHLIGMDEARRAALQALCAGESAGPDLGADHPAADPQLLELLSPALIADEPEPGTQPGLAAQRLDSDGLSWAGAYGPGTRERLRDRLRCRVWVSGLDRCGLALSFALAAAGVGSLAFRADGRLEPGDLGTSPLRLTELGLPRAAAVSRHLTRLYPHTKVLSPIPLHEGVRGADLALLVCRDGLDGRDIARLTAANLPVLPVVFNESGFRIGPLLLPSAPGCPQCRSEAWPRLPDGERLGSEAAAPETTSALLAAALAAQAAVMVLDDVNLPSVLDGTYVGTLGAAAVHFEPVASGCAHLRAA